MEQPYDIQVLDIDIIIVTYDGEIDFETRVRALNEVIAIIRKSSKKYQMLIDSRKIKNALTTMQEYEFGKMLAASEEIKGSRVAILSNLADIENQFVNTVAANRGYNLKEFVIYEDAMKWLKEI